MRILIPSLLLCMALLQSCASPIQRHSLRDGHSPISALTTYLDSGAPAQPSKRGPLRIGIAPPWLQRTTGDGFLGSLWAAEPRFGMWREGERKIIEKWGERMRSAGLVSKIVMIPSVILEDQSLGRRRSKQWQGEQAGEEPRAGVSLAAALRAASQQMGLDAVLVMHSQDAFGGKGNALGLLNITLVAMWLVPGQRMEALSLMEAALVDTATGYIYVTGSGEGEYGKTTPLMLADEEEYVVKARKNALEALGGDIERQLALRR